MEPTDLSIAEAAQRIRARKLSPTELTRAHLDRIARIDPKLNAFITVTEEVALGAARAAEDEIGRGEYRGPLHGIPIALKDLFETAGIRTTAGSKFLADFVPRQDSEVARLLKSAGCVLLGKLNMHEWAFGATNLNPHYGPCMNPWDTARLSGGSSGGSGAAVAARLCMGAMGSDTRGSIRIPASFCGITGLKSTYGRVSLRGVFPLSWHLDHAGPMARSAYDVGLLLDAVAGYDGHDMWSADMPKGDYLAGIDSGVKDWLIGVADEASMSYATPEVAQAVSEAVRVFERLGAEVIPVNIRDWIEDSATASRLMVAADAAAYHSERLKTRPEDFAPETLARFQSDAAFSATDYAQARYTQATLARRARQLLSGLNVLLTPTMPIVTPRRDDTAAINGMRTASCYTSPFNMAGVPALSVPCGFSADGLPIGLQIVAQHWHEAIALRAGYAYQTATDWHRRSPEV